MSSPPESKPTICRIFSKNTTIHEIKHHQVFKITCTLEFIQKKIILRNKAYLKCFEPKNLSMISMGACFPGTLSLLNRQPPENLDRISDLHVLASWLSKHTPFERVFSLIRMLEMIQMLGELYGGFLKWWYPTTIGVPTKNDHFGVFGGYHHFRKPPYK